MSLALIWPTMILWRKIVKSCRKIFHNYFQEFTVKTRSSNHSYQRTPQLNHFRKASYIQRTQVEVFCLIHREKRIHRHQSHPKYFQGISQFLFKKERCKLYLTSSELHLQSCSILSATEVLDQGKISNNRNLAGFTSTLKSLGAAYQMLKLMAVQIRTKLVFTTKTMWAIQTSLPNLGTTIP